MGTTIYDKGPNCVPQFHISISPSHPSCVTRNTCLTLRPATHVTLETDSPDLRLLEQKIYVGNGRFIVEDGSLSIEYKISQVQA